MSIGTLGSAGDQFRDFLGGNQRDIGMGLQAILSNYANPAGNFIRLEDRSYGMFQLSSSEHQSIFDRDAQNQYAETWYAEYRAVLMLRAEALKKKLNRAYNRVLENAIYAPLRPGESWAPEANRDVNDISAVDPMQIFSGGTIAGPVIPTETFNDSTKFVHTKWFGPDDDRATGNAYQDLRTYINETYPLEDTDGDGDIIDWTGSGYDLNGESSGTGGGTQYYNLWDSGFMGGNQEYSLASPSGAWWDEIALEMNVPPSTLTTNFINTGNPSTTYYIQIPNGKTSQTGSVLNLLPDFIRAADVTFGDGSFTTAEKNAINSGNMVWKDVLGDGTRWSLNEGTKFYDPRAIPSQTLFPAGGFGAPDGPVTNMNMNTLLVGPSGSNQSQQDVSSVAVPAYQASFVDSWYEARGLQRREAQIEAAYQAYLDGEKAINDDKTAKGKTPWTYAQVMDQVFTSIDMVGGSGGPMPPGSPPPVPSGVPTTSSNAMGGLMPYGYYYFPSGGGFAIKNNPANDMYGIGNDYGNPYPGPYTAGTGTSDPGSVYSLIYDRLAMAGDPTNMPGGNSGSAALSGSLPPGANPAFPTAPAQPADTRDVAGGTNPSNLYTPIPVGAAEDNPNGQPNINAAAGVANLDDTTHQTPGHVKDIDDIGRLFVGRQWDYAPGFVTGGTAPAVAGTDKIAPVKYEAETISSHMMILPGWWYDASGATGDVKGKALVTLPPAIDGLAWQEIASQFGLGRIDDYVNSFLGGPFFHVGGGSDSLGIYDLDGSSTKYSIAVGFGMGIGGIYWGHTSAIGTIGRIEELMDNSGVDQGKPGGTSAGPAFDIMKGSLQILAGLGGEPVNDFSIFPNVGLAGFHFDMNIPIPIPPPVGLSFLNVPMTTYGAVSYDVMTDYMYRYLDAMKHEVVDSLSVYSYATSGGYAMDSYGMRGEYHFTEKTAFESIKKMPDLFGLVPIGEMIEGAVGLLGLEDYTINQWDLMEEGIFRGDDRHSFNAAEARELDTGAFFTTASFLSQFQLNNLEYSYWTSTNQNEEAANMDTMRILAMTGKELMKLMNKALFSVAGRIDWDGPWAAVTLAVLNFMLAGFQQSVNEALMWDLLLHDQDEQGFVTTIKITNSSLKSEGYDFIEDERKLFAYDYEQSAKVGLMNKAVSGGFGSFEIPNQVLQGMANTRRYKPYLQGIDGRAGRQGWGGANALDRNNLAAGHPAGERDENGNVKGIAQDHNAAQSQGNSGDTRVHYMHRYAGDKSKYDDNWDITIGFWDDTGLGDINEVYVRKNSVQMGAVTDGLGVGTPTVTTEIDRYVGSHNRIIGRGYDGATPVNLQSFRTGYFATRYFGHYIGDDDGVNDDMVTFDVNGTIDGRSGVQINMHGGQKYYDRKNDYTFRVTTEDGTTVNLERGAALAPVFGGRMKLGTVDMHDPDQAFGASTQQETNALTKVLLDHMRIKSDGSNAQLVREYREVFNLGLLDDMFISASANAPTGGGVTSSIRLKLNAGSGHQHINLSAPLAAGQTISGTINGYVIPASASLAQLKTNIDALGIPDVESVEILGPSVIRIRTISGSYLTVNLTTAGGGTLPTVTTDSIAQAGVYEQRRDDEIVGSSTVIDTAGNTVTQNLMTVPGYLGQRSLYKNTSRVLADVYLSSFFAFKRAPKTKQG